MKLKYITFLFLLFSSTIFYAQSLNGYKYVIVPKRYDFLNKPDKHKLNSLTKFLFEKEGFKTIFDDEDFPKELANNPCLGLKANVKEGSNMLTTKLKIDLTDCSNKSVFVSEEGKSKLKDIKRGYHEALRRAFADVKSLNYRFNKNKSKVLAISNEKANVKKEDLNNEALENTVNEETNTIAGEIETETLKEGTRIKVTNEQLQVEQDNKTEVQKIEDMIQSEKNAQGETYQLYAQKTPNGFQLVDNTPKIVYKLLKTSQSNYYILEGISGIAYEKGNRWYAEYYFEGKLVRKELNIKF